MPYTVYLPPGYASSPGRRYPVLYMLHGLGGDHREWAGHGLFTAAGELMQRGEISPMIIVTPEGERGYWMDHARSGSRWGTYVARDLVSTIDGTYRTVRGRAGRAIGGVSMGGHGALQLALNHPDTFGTVGAHSPALRRKEQAFDFFGDQQRFEAHDPVSLSRKDPALPRRFAVWMDIGDKDPWSPAAEAFHQQLLAQKVNHSWRILAGGHDPTYWQAHVADYLRFYGHALASVS